MKQQILSVFDSKAEQFITPFFAPTNAVACRSFEEACNDPNQNFHKYAADYTLFNIGEFDGDTGTITSQATPVNLGVALTFIRNTEA